MMARIGRGVPPESALMHARRMTMATEDTTISPPPADDHIPGVEAIPAEMPNAEHGDISLEYNLQNFNALVSANTAMQTEISGAAERETLLREQVAAGAKWVEDLQNSLKRQQAHASEAREIHLETKAERDRLKQEIEFRDNQVVELQRKLDRTQGYLDRVLDEEDGVRAPETKTVIAPRPPVGPALGDIPRAIRRDSSGRADMDYAFHAEPIRQFDSPERPRRY
jgi:hypothetical protein